MSYRSDMEKKRFETAMQEQLRLRSIFRIKPMVLAVRQALRQLARS